MLDTLYTISCQRLRVLPRRCAIISCSSGHRAEFFFVFGEARHRTPMMAANRLSLSSRAILFLFVLIGVPGAARAATLEDSAKELARKIAAALPAQDTVSFELRNISSLRPDEVARVEPLIRSALQDAGIRLLPADDVPAHVIVTLAENWKKFVWTGEVRRGDVSHAVLFVVSRGDQNRSVSNAMHVTVRSEKFWEGPDRILDTAEVSNGSGKSWMILLRPSSLSIQDLQTGSSGKVDIAPTQSNSRDPQGRFVTQQSGNSIWFTTEAQTCKVDLETLGAPECLSSAELDRPTAGTFITLTDLSPTTSSLPGKGIERVIAPVCGGSTQFLATSARDDTQTDSLQVFQMETNGPNAMSGELDFPGPIVALHTGLDVPRAIVRNLSTGNYEAYRLAISCGQ